MDTQVQRDVRDLSRIRSLDTLPKLTLAVTRTATLVNVSVLAAPFGLTRPTIHEHLALLENVFPVDRLPSWHMNQ